MKNLRQLMAAYFHQDWWEEYDGSWEAGVADFARRAPERVPGLIEEIDTLLASAPSEDKVAQVLDDLGNYRDPGGSPTAHLDWLKAIRDSLTRI